ncbi:hypothetical protein BDV28DRAFT_145855 [Aspergillus coremiiformis]|uniref:Uncharacterized protein n=1 Tax=Aspergillus coremiiformis TaxID=138285 RepID=A0A5N6ZI53_9EURO|nr:hypothetical protein BDV28DRAFT_145855 [Aspergillus coremiiformis]
MTVTQVPIACSASSGSSFVPDGSLVAGYAALTNVSSLSASNSTSGNDTSSSSSDLRDVAMGPGRVCPWLGVLAIRAIIWVLFERRKALAAAATAAGVGPGGWAGGSGGNGNWDCCSVGGCG